MVQFTDYCLSEEERTTFDMNDIKDYVYGLPTVVEVTMNEFTPQETTTERELFPSEREFIHDIITNALWTIQQGAGIQSVCDAAENQLIHSAFGNMPELGRINGYLSIYCPIKAFIRMKIGECP